VVLGVFSYFSFYQPTLKRQASVSALQTFFTHCYSRADCLTDQSLSIDLASVTAAPTDEQELIDLLNQLLLNSNKLHKQLGRTLGVAWQNQPGTLVDEWQIVAQSLSQTLDVVSQLQAALGRQENYLVTLSDLTTVTDFKTRLGQLNTDLQTLKRQLPVWQSLAQEEELRLSLILFDNNVARRGGGEVLGYVHTTLQKGKLSAVTIQPMSEVLSAASLEINTPLVLSEYGETALEATSAYNLAFARDFSATSALSAQFLGSAGVPTPTVLASLNLNTISVLEAVTNKKDAAAVLSSLRSDVRGVTLKCKEKTLISHLNTLHTNLSKLDEMSLNQMFFAILNQLNSGEMLLYSTRDDLATAFANAGLTGEAANILCPAGFGTELCFLDTFTQTDDYLDVNVDLSQTITHTIELTPEQTKHTRRIVFDNQAGKRSAGDYLSFDLPVGAKVESLQVNGELVDFDGDKSLAVVVGAGEQTTVELVAALERTINKNDTTYSFYNQAQSGLLGQSVQVIIVNKLPYSPKIIAPSAVNEQKNIIFNQLTGQNFQGAVVF
jgi:hypothetical protein